MEFLKPGVAFAVLLLLFTGLTHLFRPGVWRETFRAWSAQGVPGVTVCGMLHALPGGLLVVLCLPDPSPTGRFAMLLGAIMMIKGTAMVLMVERAGVHLERVCAKSLTLWRAPGPIGLGLAAGLALVAWRGS